MTQTTTNNLKHTINTVDSEGNDLIIKIRLNDECKNGHEYFAITCTAYGKGKRHSDASFLYGGCCHDEILKVMPELKQFTDLHLSDCKGVPMYAIENGYYHLTEGTEYAQSYIRATDEEFKTISQASDKLHFSFLLHSLGIVARWEQEALSAIEQLEKWTGLKFQSTATKSHFSGKYNTPEQLQEAEQKLNNGYYTPAAITTRKEQAQADAKAKIIADLQAKRDKEIKEANDEYNIKIAIIESGLSIDNFIYYNHTNEGVFNWNTSSYNKAITDEQYESFRQFIHTANNGKAPIETMPPGIQFKLKK